jgi:phosphonate metabolism protein PhnN/1,5-bisphosphokinase (PRPP-forming)
MNPAQGAGAWVFVCGPSGSGKDSVIAYAQQALVSRADIVFTRRFVTRPAQTGSDHDPLTQADFAERLQSGGLRWHWQAHGFFYGIARHYEEAVRAGCLVVVNGSREHVNALPPASDARVVRITADQDALAQRLMQRGRDSAEAVAMRLARNMHFDELRADCVIVNDGKLAQAGQQLADYLADAGATQLTRSRMPA